MDSKELPNESSSPVKPTAKFTCIYVLPIWVNDVSGEESTGCDEIGTPDFYMVSHTLQNYLGGDRIWVYKVRNNCELFTINYCKTDGDGYGFIIIDDETLKKDINIIENIYELSTLTHIESNRQPSSHIKFEIIDVCDEVDN